MSQAAAKAPTQDQPAPAGEAAAPLEERIDALLDELDEAKQEVNGVVAEAEHDAIDEPVTSPDLEASIDQVIEEAQRSLGEIEPDPALNIAAGPGAVARIDDALAQSADHRMAEAEARAAAEQAQSPKPLDKTPEPEQGDFPVVSGSTEGAVVVPVVVSAPPEPLEPNTAGAAVAHTTAAQIGGNPPTPVIMSAARLLAWPMSALPIEMRDLIGWLALVTLFNAACVWLFLLL